MALMFLIGTAVVTIGLTLAFFATSFTDTGYGYRAAVQAEAAATSGAEDALLQLDRNSAFSTAFFSFGYSVPVGSSTALVKVTNSGGVATIASVATVSNRTANISVVALVNSTTSQITITSWKEQ